MNQFMEDKNEIMNEISKLLDNRYLNLAETGRFSSSDIGKEIGKIIASYNIKKKFQKNKVDMSSCSVSVSVISDDVCSCSSDYFDVSIQMASAEVEMEYVENSREILRNYSDFFGCLFVNEKNDY